MQLFEHLEMEFKRQSDPLEHVVACSSGTAALHLALESLGLPERSRVIVPNYTMVACARAVILAGLSPVFADCTNHDLLIDPNSIKRLLYNYTGIRAIMPVHIYGRRCNMSEIVPIAERNGCYVIEDMAEMHGVAPHSHSTAACYSFYKNKLIAGEEGGAVAFNLACESMSDKAKCLRSVGFTDKHDYTHIPRGHNYRMSNAHAGLILDSMSKQSYHTDLRNWKIEELDDVCPKDWKMPERKSPWVYDIRIPGMGRTIQVRLMDKLRNVGYGARYGFHPLTLQEEFRHCIKDGDIAEKLHTEIIYLTIQPEETQPLSPAQVFDLIRKEVD